jgi:hypothetical protein
MTTIRYTKGKWECRAMIKYKYILIGYFDTEQQAIDEYNKFIDQNNLNRKKKYIRKVETNL